MKKPNNFKEAASFVRKLYRTLLQEDGYEVKRATSQEMAALARDLKSRLKKPGAFPDLVAYTLTLHAAAQRAGGGMLKALSELNTMIEADAFDKEFTEVQPEPPPEGRVQYFVIAPEGLPRVPFIAVDLTLDDIEELRAHVNSFIHEHLSAVTQRDTELLNAVIRYAVENYFIQHPTKTFEGLLVERELPLYTIHLTPYNRVVKTVRHVHKPPTFKTLFEVGKIADFEERISYYDEATINRYLAPHASVCPNKAFFNALKISDDFLQREYNIENFVRGNILEDLATTFVIKGARYLDSREGISVVVLTQVRFEGVPITGDAKPSQNPIHHLKGRADGVIVEIEGGNVYGRVFEIKSRELLPNSPSESHMAQLIVSHLAIAEGLSEAVNQYLRHFGFHVKDVHWASPVLVYITPRIALRTFEVPINLESPTLQHRLQNLRTASIYLHAVHKRKRLAKRYKPPYEAPVEGLCFFGKDARIKCSFYDLCWGDKDLSSIELNFYEEEEQAQDGEGDISGDQGSVQKRDGDENSTPLQDTAS